MKAYYVQSTIGTAKYVVNFHNGVTKHADGSDFYDIRIFKNKKDRDKFLLLLQGQGYQSR